jgi:hypothetical protein
MRVQAHGEEAFIVHPENIVEQLLELLSLVIEPCGLMRVAEPPQNFRHVKLRDVYEALFLTGGNGRLHLRAVVVHDGIAPWSERV